MRRPAALRPLSLRFSQESGVRGWLLGQAGRGGPLARLGLLAAAMTIFAAAAWRAQQAQTLEHTATAARQAELARQGRQPADPAGAPALSPAQREAWSRIVAPLNTPWPDLMDALEAGTPDNVAVVAIEPDARQGRVRLQAEARDLDTLLAYAARLDAADAFAGVALVRHETNEQDPNRPVRLTLDARLRAPRLAARAVPAASSAQGDTR